jgi:surfeit locus 1 family protein
VRRLKWKNDLVQDTEEKLSWDPIPLPGRVKYVLRLTNQTIAVVFNSYCPVSACNLFLSVDALSDYMYRRFLVRGILQPQQSVLIGPRKYGEIMGYHLIMPLARSAEPGAPATLPSTVLVNLGFVSNEAAESYRAPASSSSPSSSSALKSGLPEFSGKETTIEAIIPTPQTPNWFTPENKPERGEWVWADVQALAQHAGGKEAGVVPLLLDEVFGSYDLVPLGLLFPSYIDFICGPFFFPGGNIGEANQRIAKGVPVGRAPVVAFRNEHASYAVTWFVELSLAVSFSFQSN